jgi:hypothetical protein
MTGPLTRKEKLFLRVYFMKQKAFYDYPKYRDRGNDFDFLFLIKQNLKNFKGSKNCHYISFCTYLGKQT